MPILAGSRKGLWFLATVAALSLAGSATLAVALGVRTGAPLATAFWMFGFVLLAINVSYLAVSLVVRACMKEVVLPEAPLLALPRTAIAYVVRNERADVLFENLRYSLGHNRLDHFDAWILSNSDLDDYVAGEGRVVTALEAEFGGQRIGYFRPSRNPLFRKHVCVHEWLDQQDDYQYVLLCDADSRLPPGSIRRLVAKAEHPDNADVVLFQSHISIDEQSTHFVGIFGLAQDVCQWLYARVHQRVFDRGVSYGSGHLVRVSAFTRIRVPSWVLSHDIWDTVALEERGGRVVFCGDVRTLGSFPANYIEYLNRSRRWILGTLESAAFCATRPIPLGTRFMTLYPTYMYLFQPLFIGWVTATVLFDARLWTSMFAAQQYAFVGASAVDLEMGSHLALTLAMALAPGVLGGRSVGSALQVFGDMVTSVVLSLSSILFDAFAVIEYLATNKKGREWAPMKKGNPEALHVGVVVRRLWPAVALGAVGLGWGFVSAPRWTLVAAPFLCSFLLSVPLAYWTARARRPGPPG